MGSTTPKSGCLFLLALLISGGWAASGDAQALRVRQQGTHGERIAVGVGEVVTLEVYADLQGAKAAGVSFFMTIPADAFQVVDQVPQSVGVQPFLAGPLFSGGAQYSNLLLSETDPAAVLPGQQLEYSAVVGGGANRERTGTGVVATLQLICVAPIDNGRIAIDDSPIRETRLVLADGISERRFITVEGMEISVSGIELRDIPDVILLPGRADSVTIGSLSAFVASASVPVDSLRWSYAPTELDSLRIEVDPVTRRVTITPLDGWIGRQQIVWTATEPVARVPGFPPLSQAEISTIIVNNPPRFTLDADTVGVKRDTIRFREDQYPFTADGGTPDLQRAFRWIDLDEIVIDPDVDDPQKELNFAALSYGAFRTENSLRAQVDPATHELLVWSRQEFSGVDSLKVFVRDGLRGGEDSLRVIVEVASENDPPRFTISDLNPKISNGGSKVYRLNEIVTDSDTPIDSLDFSWVDDPGGHFTVTTAPVDTTLAVTVKGAAGFSGTGRVTFTIADPLDPQVLTDRVVLFIESSEILPPDVFPDQIKVDLIPGGDPFTDLLDDYVEDPDNADSELAWLLPPTTYRAEIGIDETRTLRVRAPVSDIGYEEVLLTVTDPAHQSDFCTLRIYSSQENPVVGGIPDLILDRGEVHQSIDLDNYYYDSDNRDEEMYWEVLRTFDTANLLVNVDGFTHVITLTVPLTAAFKTETVVFRVSDPAGKAATDTMLVTIRSGGDPGVGSFVLRPLPTDMQVPVGQFTDVLDLDDYVIPADTNVSWSVALLAGNHSIPQVAAGNILSVFGLTSGVDTLQLTARDTLGRIQTTVGTVRVIGEGELLNLLSIPDVQFIAGQTYTSDTLSVYIEDRIAHPDSVVEWSLEKISDTGSIFPTITADRTLFATARDTGTAEVVLLARNVRDQVTGRDTIRIIALDANLGNLALKDFPPLVIRGGKTDTSVVLDEYLPEELLGDESVPVVRWGVSGQTICQPVIDPQAPHRLRVTGVGKQIGLDTLVFVADVGGGFRARGPLVVTVVEDTDENTLALNVVPNPVNPRFIDVFVIARRELAGTPNVFRTYAASDSTVAMQKTEDRLDEHGVLIWSGSTRLGPDADGTVFFQAQAFTALGTDIKDTTSVALATAVAGKPLRLTHGCAALLLPADAVPPGTAVLLRTDATAAAVDAKPTAAGVTEELELVRRVQALPTGMALARAGALRVAGMSAAGEAVYRRCGERWRFFGRLAEDLPVKRLGEFAVCRDLTPPTVTIDGGAVESGKPVRVMIMDAGSGLLPTDVTVWLDGETVSQPGQYGADAWMLELRLDPGDHVLEVEARDRVGNCNRRRCLLKSAAAAVPNAFQLGRNFPNPFNPETTIPFTISAAAARSAAESGVCLVIYNPGGQVVRSLLQDEAVAPGAYRVVWDGRDRVGKMVGSGVYICRLQIGRHVLSRRMTLLK